MVSKKNGAQLADAINDVMRRIYTGEARIDWRSQERRPGGGCRRSRYRGAGDDYDGSKPYVPGDNSRYIDWKAYAVSGGQDVSIKTFKMTTEITAYVLVDIAPSMEFGTVRATKRHLAAELAGSVIRSMNETQDRAGFIVYSDKRLEISQTPRGAKSVVYPAVAAALSTERSDDGPGSGFAQASSRLPHQRSLVYVVSDFMNMTNHDWQALIRVGQQHDLLCLYVQDPRERQLPEFKGGGLFGWMSRWIGGFYDLQDWTGANRTIWVGRSTRAKYADNFRQHEAAILGRFNSCNSRYVIVSTDEGEASRPRIIRAINGYREPMKQD